MYMEDYKNKRRDLMLHWNTHELFLEMSIKDTTTTTIITAYDKKYVTVICAFVCLMTHKILSILNTARELKNSILGMPLL
jgi:hypothetical protein